MNGYIATMDRPTTIIPNVDRLRIDNGLALFERLRGESHLADHELVASTRLSDNVIASIGDAELQHTNPGW